MSRPERTKTCPSLACALWAIALGCGGEKPSPSVGDDDDDVDTDTTAECAIDDDCAPGLEICEAGACVEGDRDVDFAAAIPIAIGDGNALHGVLSPAGDVDRYVYQVTEPQWVSVRTVTDPYADVDTVVSVYDADEALYAVMDDYPVYPFRVGGTLENGDVVTFDSVLYVYLDAPGAWYLTVQDATSYYPDLTPAGGADFAYDLLIREATGGGETDGPDDPSIAVTLDTETSVVAYGVVIGDPGDTDYAELDFAFDDHLLEVWSQPDTPGSSADPLVRIVDAGTVVAEKSGLGEDGYISWFRGHAGTFTIEATDAGGGGGPDAWFTLYLRTYADGDAHPFFGENVYTSEVEPNEDPPSATAIPRDALDAFRFDAAVDVVDDADWFSVDARDGDLLSIRCWTERFGSPARLEVSMWADGTMFSSDDTPDADDFYAYAVEPPRPGRIDVLVHESGGGIGPAGWYRCAVYAQP